MKKCLILFNQERRYSLANKTIYHFYSEDNIYIINCPIQLFINY